MHSAPMQPDATVHAPPRCVLTDAGLETDTGFLADAGLVTDAGFLVDAGFLADAGVDTGT